MREQINKIVRDKVKDESVADAMIKEINDLIFEGKDNCLIVSPQNFKKFPVEGGWLYCFWNNKFEDWENNWGFVPKIPE